MASNIVPNTAPNMMSSIMYNMAPNMETQEVWSLVDRFSGYGTAYWRQNSEIWLGLILGFMYKGICDPIVGNIVEFNAYGYWFDPTLELVCIASPSIFVIVHRYSPAI